MDKNKNFLEKKKALVTEERDYLDDRESQLLQKIAIINHEIKNLEKQKDVMKTERLAIRRRLSQLSEEGYLYVASDEEKEHLNTDYKAKFDIFE